MQSNFLNGAVPVLLPQLPAVPGLDSRNQTTEELLQQQSSSAPKNTPNKQDQSGSQSKKSGAKLAAAVNSTGALLNGAEDDHGDDGDGDDPNKRRRVARACDSCRKKKVRCDGIDPPHRESCTNCSTYGHECTFLNAAKRRAPPRR